MTRVVSKKERVLVLITIIFFIQLWKYKITLSFFNILLLPFSFFDVLPWVFLMWVFWNIPLTRFQLYFSNYLLLFLVCLISLFYRGENIFFYPIPYILGFLLFLFAYKIENIINRKK
jgi:hypothetical protein